MKQQEQRKKEKLIMEQITLSPAEADNLIAHYCLDIPPAGAITRLAKHQFSCTVGMGPNETPVEIRPGFWANQDEVDSVIYG